MLGRVESPGFHHTAVMLGCVEPLEAAPVANKYRNILKAETCAERVEPPRSQHTAVLLSCVGQSEAEYVANNHQNIHEGYILCSRGWSHLDLGIQQLDCAEQSEDESVANNHRNIPIES